MRSYDRDLVNAIQEFKRTVSRIYFYYDHNNIEEVSEGINTLMTYAGDSIEGYTPMVFLLDDKDGSMQNTIRNIRSFKLATRYEDIERDPAFEFMDTLITLAFVVENSSCEYYDRDVLDMLSGWARETAEIIRRYAVDTDRQWEWMRAFGNDGNDDRDDGRRWPNT